MIITILKGGLGNQMFQYATGRALAERTASKLYMDLSWFNNVADIDTPRHYELERFSLKQNFISPKRYAAVEPSSGLKIIAYNYTKGLIRPRVTHYVEQGHIFNKSFSSLDDDTCIEGWWQTEKYFKDIRQILLKDFSYRKEPSSENKDYLNKIKGANSVSLHVRRGDYANNKNANTFHGLMGMEYYQAAIARIGAKIKDPHFFVFSDEPDWCKKNLKIKYRVTYVSGNKDGSEDMRLMRECSHNVLANSTFSWWGAWLNDNTDKIVIAPKRWFNDSSVDTSDVIPKDWIRI